jgi:hypothetical protein
MALWRYNVVDRMGIIHYSTYCIIFGKTVYTAIHIHIIYIYYNSSILICSSICELKLLYLAVLQVHNCVWECG